MKLIYTKSITKDVQKIKDRDIQKAIYKTIQKIKNASHLNEIPSVKKLKGHSFAYRIRISNYRLGFYFEDDTIILARFLKRNDIYKVFPK